MKSIQINLNYVTSHNSKQPALYPIFWGQEHGRILQLKQKPEETHEIEI